MAVSIVTNKNERLSNCLFIGGLTGFGSTGYLIVSYLVSALSARRIGFIQTKNMPAFTFMDGKKLVTPFELYRRNHLVLMKTEFSFHRNDEAALGKCLSDWIIDRGISEAVLFGSLDCSLKNGDSESVRLLATSAYLPKTKKLKVPLLESGLVVYGPIATMMVNFEIRRFPAAAVLTYDAPYRPDFKSASDALRKLCAAYNLNLDLSVLEAGEWCIGEERKRQIQSEGLWNGMFV